jgi:hypothetical protein
MISVLVKKIAKKILVNTITPFRFFFNELICCNRVRSANADINLLRLNYLIAILGFEILEDEKKKLSFFIFFQIYIINK